MASTEAVTVTEQKPVSPASGVLSLKLPVKEYRSLPVPGVEHARMGTCFVRVVDLPGDLDRFMAINPRVPARTGKGVLKGPVIAGILATLREEPEAMVLKNQGMHVLVESAEFQHNKSGLGVLKLRLSDAGKHGIVNGGHTYAAIREAVETASPEELQVLSEAYVKVHILEGVEAALVPEIAEGLNRSKQVDDPSLLNLQGEFDTIRKALKGTPAAEVIAYHQGDAGEVYISEVLVYLSMLDTRRYTEARHPANLYNRQAFGLKNFLEDREEHRKDLATRIGQLPQILRLVDLVREGIPAAAKQAGFKFGLGKANGQRMGGKTQSGMRLPFLGRTIPYRIPNGWVYPIVAGLRAAISAPGKWKKDPEKILADLLPSLVAVCIAEHKESGGRPELVGKKEAAYSQCYTKVELYLARRGL